MTVAALSVITANPVVIMAAESKEGQTVKPTDTNTPSEKNSTISVDSNDKPNEDDSRKLLPTKWNKDNCSYNYNTKTLTITATEIDNSTYSASKDHPINPVQIAWNLDGVDPKTPIDTNNIECIVIKNRLAFKGDASSLFSGLLNLKKIERLINLDTKKSLR